MMFRRNGLKLPIWFSLAVIFVGVMLAGVGISGCKKAKSDPFPVSGVVAGWEKTSDTRTFAAKDLYQYIDGDAEQYIAAGVVTTSTSDYKFQGQLEATVDVHTIGDAAVAYGQSVIFRKGIYLVRIVAFQSTPGASDALQALARGIEAKL